MMRFYSALPAISLLSVSCLFYSGISKDSADKLTINSGCPHVIEKVKGGNNPLETTFLFIDKSVSLKPAKSFAISKYQGEAKRMLRKHIHQEGDRLVVYQVHHSTLTGKEFDKPFSTSIKLEDICNKADKVIAELTTQYRREILTQSNASRKRIGKILTDGIGVAGKQTDLWGTLQVICEENPGTPIVNVYYFSDMVESMKGANRRDLHKHYPKTIDEANQFAAEDLKQIKKVCVLKPSILRTLRLTIVLPHPPGVPPTVSKPYVRTYWQQLLVGLGVKQISFV